MPTPLTDRLLVLAAALLFSTGGAAIKAVSLNAWQVASLRSAVGALALLVLVPPRRDSWNRRVIPVGAAYAATLALFVLANKLTTAANAIFLQDAAPLYLVALGPLLLKEPARRQDLLMLGVVAAGIAMFFVGEQPASRTAPRPLEGNVVATIAGVTWALTIAGLRWLGSRHGEIASVAPLVGNLLAFLACLPAALPLRGVGWRDALVIAYLGVFQIGIAYVCLTRAIRRVRALEASLLLMAEPALNPVWTWLVHGERPGGWALAGGALILGACAAHSWRQQRTR